MEVKADLPRVVCAQACGDRSISGRSPTPGVAFGEGCEPFLSICRAEDIAQGFDLIFDVAAIVEMFARMNDWRPSAIIVGDFSVNIRAVASAAAIGFITRHRFVDETKRDHDVPAEDERKGPRLEKSCMRFCLRNSTRSRTSFFT